ncbi:hypothetical protein GCM10010182_06850 [Actinomadura cremea]|nr:hypothetical protein GCM10010182_06850 [Actinomadura cremea]
MDHPNITVVDDLGEHAFSPDGSRLVTGSVDESVKVWNTGTGALVRTIGVGEKPAEVVFAPDGSTFATGNETGMA